MRRVWFAAWVLMIAGCKESTASEPPYSPGGKADDDVSCEELDAWVGEGCLAPEDEPFEITDCLVETPFGNRLDLATACCNGGSATHVWCEELRSPSEVQALEVQVTLLDRSELFDAEADGWEYDEDKGGFVHAGSYTAAGLPWRQDFEGFSVRIDSDGEVTLRYATVDDDVEVRARGYLPMEEGRFTIPLGGFKMELRGGDYAGGSWAAEGAVTILLQD